MLIVVVVSGVKTIFIVLTTQVVQCSQNFFNQKAFSNLNTLNLMIALAFYGQTYIVHNFQGIICYPGLHGLELSVLDPPISDLQI